MLDIEFQSTRRIKKEKDMAQDFSSLREDELNGKVKECLKRNRYLLVMDDLWKNQVWDEGENAFLDNNQGSRILDGMQGTFELSLKSRARNFSPLKCLRESIAHLI